MPNTSADVVVIGGGVNGTSIAMHLARVAGGMNGVMFDHADGVIRGAACYRADGVPAGYSGGAARPSDDPLYRF